MVSRRLPCRNSRHLSCLNSRHLSCLSSRHLSCLSSRNQSCLNSRHLSCLNNTLFVRQKQAKGPTHAIATDLDNRTVTFQTDWSPMYRIAVPFGWTLPFGELLRNPESRFSSGWRQEHPRSPPPSGRPKHGQNLTLPSNSPESLKPPP